MRTVISRIALAAAITAAAATPAAAQDLAREAVRPASAMTVTRAVAVYTFAVPQKAGLPAEVTLTDRGGMLTATYRLAGARDAQPMEVTILDTDIVLQADTEQGVLTLQLFQQNDPSAASKVSGKWTLGERSGSLRGTK